MAYFTNFQNYLFLYSDLSSIEKGGKPSHNPFRLFSAIRANFKKIVIVPNFVKHTCNFQRR